MFGLDTIGGALKGLWSGGKTGAEVGGIGMGVVGALIVGLIAFVLSGFNPVVGLLGALAGGLLAGGIGAMGGGVGGSILGSIWGGIKGLFGFGKDEPEVAQQQERSEPSSGLGFDLASLVPNILRGQGKGGPGQGQG